MIKTNSTGSTSKNDPLSLIRKSSKQQRNLNSNSNRIIKSSAQDALALAEWNARKWVWVPDQNEGFVQGYVVKEDSGKSTIALASGELIQEVPSIELERVNPPSYDGSEDIAELTYLNEASVVHNLRFRYMENEIYTYSGLFLVAINPYKSLPIYTPEVIEAYKHKRPDENGPHIYAVAEKAWQAMLTNRDQSQSVLVTGESGAGKTENTKKVIQYLAAIASESTTSSSSSSSPPSTSSLSSSFNNNSIDPTTGKKLGYLERQILEANPILEAFGNAQTIKNDNSSRFGKFVRIFFDTNGGIAGANIDWYLLEKSRVTGRSPLERNFHIFYQLLSGGEKELKDRLLLNGAAKDFNYLQGRSSVQALNDKLEWKATTNALTTVGFTPLEQFDLFRVISSILHLGNITVTGSTTSASLPVPSQLEKLSFLLGLSPSSLIDSLIRPKVKAGKEWVTQSRTEKQVRDELAALAKCLYEKSFGKMVERINNALGRPSTKTFIGVLDIAGFEIFDVNGFEQLCINLTNEKLQQFFNHHMFVVEQEEYEREEIAWDKLNFGLELQPTIDLIESSNPVGILAALDDACLMPKANDAIFTTKMHQLAEVKPISTQYTKYTASRFDQGFTVSHYAGRVEYRTSGWIDSNRDPLSESVSSLLASSTIPYIASLFTDELETDSNPTGEVSSRSARVRRGAFRTVGQRHKERLAALMTQLRQTQPHFVRCIVPNTSKSPLLLDAPLVLDQLRCNGVLEGIRIARLGYPNRLPFSDFRRRFEIITPGVIPKGLFIEGAEACTKMLHVLELDPRSFKVGLTKVFFKAGILAELEERRDDELSAILSKVQASCRGFMARRQAHKILNRAAAVRTIQRNARIYIALRNWPWWPLYQKIRPLLAAARNDDAMRRQEEELVASRELAEAAALERKKLELAQIELEAEKVRIEKDLENERATTRLREELLLKSKAREAELEEDCQLMQEDMATLDDQLNRAMSSISESEDRIQDLNAAFANSNRLLATLEAEQVAWKLREATLASQTSVKTEEWEKMLVERDQGIKDSSSLRRDLVELKQDSEREKERLSTSISALERRLAGETKDSTETRSKLLSVETELKSMKEDLSRISKERRDLESEIKLAKAEILRGHSDQVKFVQERDTAVSKAQDLQSQLNSTSKELAESTRQLEINRDLYNKADADLKALRNVVATNASDKQKQVEVDRIRDAEHQTLLDRFAKTEALLTSTLRDADNESSRLRKELDHSRTELKNVSSQLNDVSRTASTTTTRLSELQLIHDDLERQNQAHDLHLEIVRAETAEAILRERKKFEEEMSHMRSKCSSFEDRALRSERKEAAARRDGAALQTLLEVEQNAAAEKLRNEKSLAAKMDQQYSVLADLDKINGNLRSEMAAIKARLRVAEDKAGRTVIEHVRVLEEAQRLQNADMDRMRSDRDQRDAYVKTLEKARISLTQTVEDLQHERDSERKAAWASKPAPDNSAARLTEALESEKKLRQLAELNVARLRSEIQHQQSALENASLEIAELRRTNTRFERELNTIVASDHNEHTTLPKSGPVAVTRQPLSVPTVSLGYHNHTQSTVKGQPQPPPPTQGSRRRNYE